MSMLAPNRAPSLEHSLDIIKEGEVVELRQEIEELGKQVEESFFEKAGY
ncbi:MAG: hypothetical protein RBG13Loki_3378 [Promethearchaeota archaeon CR_4]|nr:MAG: hypothetical protein RBG13Loki_3378 [Candidatus Lokiarchaeota archaeon CR_4]